MRRSFLAVAVVLPLVALTLAIVQSEHRLAEGRRWSFQVTGYDPRDLLRGHYIQYRVVLDEVDLPVYGAGDGASCDDDTTDACCFCLSADWPGGPTTVERTACELARSECDGALPLRYLGELERYYIAEERAGELTKIFQAAANENQARLVVAIGESGKPQIDTLLIDEIPIEQAKPAAAAPDDDSVDAPDGDSADPGDRVPVAAPDGAPADKQDAPPVP